MNIPRVLAPLKLPEGASSTSSPTSSEPKSPRRLSPPLLMSFALGMERGRELALIYSVSTHFSPNIKGCIPVGRGWGGGRLDFLNYSHPPQAHMRLLCSSVGLASLSVELNATEVHRNRTISDFKPYTSTC